jgi:alkylhydroperoxidase family enzyme
MSRISRVGRSEAEGRVREWFERFAAQRGNIPNMFRVAAIRPALLDTMLAHFAEVMRETTISAKFKELLAVQTSVANACHY